MPNFGPRRFRCTECGEIDAAETIDDFVWDNFDQCWVNPLGDTVHKPNERISCSTCCADVIEEVTHDCGVTWEPTNAE